MIIFTAGSADDVTTVVGFTACSQLGNWKYSTTGREQKGGVQKEEEGIQEKSGK